MDVIEVTLNETKDALQAISKNYPELERAMEVTRALLVRLETLNHEAKLPLSLALNDASDITKSRILGAIGTLGERGCKHRLELLHKQFTVQ